MDKKLIKQVAFFILIWFIVLYFCFSFYYLSLNATKWDQNARGLFSVLGILFPFLAAGVAAGIESPKQ